MVIVDVFKMKHYVEALEFAAITSLEENLLKMTYGKQGSLGSSR
jgi:hypothetical protein